MCYHNKWILGLNVNSSVFLNAGYVTVVVPCSISISMREAHCTLTGIAASQSQAKS